MISAVDYKFVNKNASLTAVFCQDDGSSVMCSVKNDALSADVDATQSHMKPVVVLETLDLARSVSV